MDLSLSEVAMNTGAYYPNFRGPAFYAKRASTTTPEQLQTLAWEEIRRRRAYAKLSLHAPVRIRVIRAQGKPLLVLRIGAKFVSAFTWPNLIKKAAWGPWKDIRSVTLAKRWH